MKRILLFTICLFVGVVATAQTVTTPNIGLQLPAYHSNNWNVPLNYNFSQLDRLLSGTQPLPGLQLGFVNVSGLGTFGSLKVPILNANCLGTDAAGNVVLSTCSLVGGVTSFNTRVGPVTLQLADVTGLGTLANDISGLAARASELAASPTLCPAGQAPRGIDVFGNATGCAVIGGGGSSPGGSTYSTQYNAGGGTFGGGGPGTAGQVWTSNGPSAAPSFQSLSGVQYNPSTTVVYGLSSSILADDNRSTSVAVPVSTWSCNGTTCDVNTSSNHNLTTNSWVDLIGMTGWFSGNPYGGQQDTTYGSFKIASIVSPTEFTVAYTRNTGSGSGGNIYDASNWGIYKVAAAPFFNGHGTVYYWWSPLSSAATNISTFLPTCTIGPCYLKIQAGQNDIASGRTDGQIEGNLLTIMGVAHTKGYIVEIEPILPTNYGLGVTNLMWQYTQSVNQWIRSQGKTQANASSGQYWDFIIDPTPYDSDRQSMVGSNAYAGNNYATIINQGFASQAGFLSTAPIFFPWESGIGLGNQNIFFIGTGSGNFDDAAIFESGKNQWHYHQTYGNFGTSFPLFDYNWDNIAVGNHVCNALNMADGSGNNHFSLCVKYAGSGSANNYVSIGRNGDADAIILYADGRIQIPGVVASSGTSPLCVDTAGNVSQGGCGGGSFTNPMTTLGDIITGGASGTATRLAGPTSGTDTYVLESVPSGGVATAPSWLDLNTFLASPPSIGNTAPGLGKFSSLYDTSLTVGNCVQIGTGGQLVSAAGPCGTPSGTVTVTGTPSAGDIAAFSGPSSITTATASQVNTLLATLSGCSTVGNVYVPQSGTCVPPSGGGGSVTVGSINPNGYQTPVLVQSGTAFNNAGSGTITKAFTSNVTSGNLIHVYTYGNINGGNSISCTDSNSPTPTFIAGSQIGGAGNPQNNSFVWVVSASGPDTVSCTFTNYASNSAIEIEEWSGLTATKEGTKSYGDFGYGSSNQFPFQSLGINTVTPNDMIFSTSANQANISGASFGGGADGWNYPYTTGWFPSTNYAVAIAYRILPYAGTTSAIFNNNYGAGQSSYIFALKAKTTTAVSCTTSGSVYVNTAALPKAQSFVCNGSGTWIPF